MQKLTFAFPVAVWEMVIIAAVETVISGELRPPDLVIVSSSVTMASVSFN